MKYVANTILVDLPTEQELVTLEEFVDRQERHVRAMSKVMVAKSMEVEQAVDDMLGVVVSFMLDPMVPGVSEGEIIKVKSHYNWALYQSLLKATKRSLQSLKSRLSTRSAASQGAAFFAVELQLDGLGIRLSPTVDEIQTAINGGAIAVLKCSKMVVAWDTVTIPRNIQIIMNPNLPPVKATDSRGSFYDRVAQDREILKTVLLLQGSIQSARDQCTDYFKQFLEFQWLWADDIEKEYTAFMTKEPSLDEFETKLMKFSKVEESLDRIPGVMQTIKDSTRVEKCVCFGLIQHGLGSVRGSFLGIFRRT